MDRTLAGTLSTMGLAWSGDARIERLTLEVPTADTSVLPPASGVQCVAAREELDPSSETFIELYRTHVAYVWRAARRLGIPAAEADDVVQETFLQALRLSDSYTSRGSDRGWLFAILYNVVQHHCRSRRRWAAKTEDGIDLDVLPTSPAASPDQRAETSENVRILEQILDGLDPERRAVLVLAELEERPVSEIAEILGINLNTATSRLRLARAQVEAALARHRARDGWRYK